MSHIKGWTKQFWILRVERVKKKLYTTQYKYDDTVKYKPKYNS